MELLGGKAMKPLTEMSYQEMAEAAKTASKEDIGKMVLEIARRVGEGA